MSKQTRFVEMNEPEKLIVNVSETDRVTALLYLAAKQRRARTTIILGHGAGAGQLHPFMQLFAKGLAERGFDVLTFNFCYLEQGRHVPDPKARLESCYRAVIRAARTHKKLQGNRLVIGGKSMGGRIASQVAALDYGNSTPLSNAVANSNRKSKTQAGSAHARPPAPIAGLVFLGYPLHPPGRPDKLRDAHLPQIQVPMLFIQGSRDAFGTEEEISALIKRLKLPATLHAVNGGDHSLKVPKSAVVSQPEVYAAALDAIAKWLNPLTSASDF
jgi:predicted alpha/beta-hydrolase family hydrolase